MIWVCSKKLEANRPYHEGDTVQLDAECYAHASACQDHSKKMVLPPPAPFKSITKSYRVVVGGLRVCTFL